MRLVFFGTPEFAVPALNALLDAGHDVVLAVTQPDRPRGRSRDPRPPPVKECAARRGIPVLQPERMRDPAFLDAIRAIQPDAGIVVAYGKLLPQALLDIPAHGFLNIHASLLPRYRGAAPILAAIRDGEAETGVSIMQVVQELDAGPVHLQRRLPIADSDSTASLTEKLAALGGAGIVEALRELEAGRARPVPQDPARVTHIRPLRKEDGRIDWTLPPRALDCFARAMDPWPGAFGEHQPANGGPAARWTIFRMRPAANAGLAAPGTVIAASKMGCVVACGGGAMELLEAQLPGKKRLSVGAILAGYSVAIGDRFV